MSAKKISSGILGIPLIAAALGAFITALALAGMAQWMLHQGWSASAAAPLASISVCAGSLCSGVCAAVLKKEKGLLNGAVQGIIFAGSLLLAALLDGNAVESIHLIRCMAVLLCGAAGGLLGMSLRERKHG